MGEVARFGGEDDDNPEVAKFLRKNGTPEDMSIVNALSFDSVRAALALWTAGATYADIAAQLKYRSPLIAQLAIERALSEMVDDHTDRSKLRRKMSLTLERLMRGIMTKALDQAHPEQLAAVRATLAIADRYSKLLGLDAPTEINVHMPDNDEFQRFIQLAATAQGMNVPVEADPFSDEYIDAEVVEDENPEESAG
jgi:hypothetical protein